MNKAKAPYHANGALLLSELIHHRYRPLQALTQTLDRTAEALEKEIHLLRQIGYDIQCHPHHGYFLTSLPDVVISDEIEARLPKNPFACHTQVFRELDSTNEFLLREANRSTPPLPHATTIIAEKQTKGRGRLQRSWDSASHLGLWSSFLFRPQEYHWPVQHYHRLTLIAAVALQKAIHTSCNITTYIKWPNDILHNGLKLAGILTETSYQANTVPFLVLGMGCNINHNLNDFPPELQSTATSLKIANNNTPIRRVEVLTELMQQLEICFHQPWEQTMMQWRSHCSSIGQRLTVRRHHEVIHGQMLNIDEQGHLILRTDHGRTLTINSGDVTTH